MSPGDLRVLFFSSGPYGQAVLERLEAEGFQPVGVVTTPPAPRGRGHTFQPTPQARFARERGLPLWETRKPHEPEVLEALKALRPDFLLVCDYGVILKPAVLRLPRFLPLNIHPSLLPRWRGAAPMERSLLARDPVVGGTLMVMDEGMDTGPWLLMEGWPHTPDRTKGDHWDRWVEAGARLFLRYLELFSRGKAPEPLPQEGEPTLAPKIRPEERWVDWEENPEHLAARIHAFSPTPGVRARVRGKVWKLLRVCVIPRGDVPHPGEGEPLRLGDRLVLGLRDPDRILEVLELQVEGRRGMTAAEFLRGARDL